MTIKKLLYIENPELFKQIHPEKNCHIDTLSLSPYSNKKVWWLCNNGHEWESSIGNRNGINKNQCPFCSNKKVCLDNCLQTTCPELANEWNVTKNSKLTPFDVTCGSKEKVWWICEKKHEWETRVYVRQRSGCPYCTNRFVCIDNCLKTINSDLSHEWHPTKNGRLTPEHVVCGCNKKVWWLCNNGHEWKSSINSRNDKKFENGCPYCANKKVCFDNCLQTTNPELAKEWHPNRNRLLSPLNVTYGSKKKVWWKCNKNHEWCAQIYSRTNKLHPSGCPFCNESKGEKVIKNLLNNKKIAFIPQKKFNDCRSKYPLPFDFYLPKLNICIEFHGEQHDRMIKFYGGDGKFEKLQKHDRIKKNYCKKKKIKLLIIKYQDNICHKINSFFQNNY